MALMPYPMPCHFRLHVSGLLFHRMVCGNNTEEIYLDSMDYEIFLPIVAAFLGCHLTNVTRALRKKSGETIIKLAKSDTQYNLPQIWARLASIIPQGEPFV